MTTRSSATYSAMSFRTAPTVRRPVQQPIAIMAARARNTSDGLVARSQYARKPALLVVAEYGVWIGSFAVALHYALSM